jgi:hypothetical protein
MVTQAMPTSATFCICTTEVKEIDQFHLFLFIKAKLKTEHPKKVTLENREQLPVQMGNCLWFCAVF